MSKRGLAKGKKALCSFWRRQAGIASIEFAILAPMVFFVLAIALESSRLCIAYALINRAMSEGIEQAKLHRGVNAQLYLTQALEKWRFGVFNPKDIKLTLTSSPTMSTIMTAAVAGGGGAGDSVHLKMEAKLGVLEKVLPEDNPMKGDVEQNYYYINEPEAESEKTQTQ